MTDTVDITLQEAIDFLSSHYCHDGQMGDMVIDCCIELLQRVDELVERQEEDPDAFAVTDCASIIEYLKTGNDWEEDWK